MAELLKGFAEPQRPNAQPHAPKAAIGDEPHTDYQQHEANVSVGLGVFARDHRSPLRLFAFVVAPHLPGVKTRPACSPAASKFARLKVVTSERVQPSPAHGIVPLTVREAGVLTLLGVPFPLDSPSTNCTRPTTSTKVARSQVGRRGGVALLTVVFGGVYRRRDPGRPTTDQVAPLRSGPAMMRVHAPAAPVIADEVIEDFAVGDGANLALVPIAIDQNPAHPNGGLCISVVVAGSGPDVAPVVVLNPSEAGLQGSPLREVSGHSFFSRCRLRYSRMYLAEYFRRHFAHRPSFSRFPASLWPRLQYLDSMIVNVSHWRVTRNG